MPIDRQMDKDVVQVLLGKTAAAKSTLLYLRPGTSDWAFPGRAGTAGALHPRSPNQLGSSISGGEGRILLCRTQALPAVRMRAQGENEESEKVSKMSSLLERLHAKFNQNRPWSETIKLLRQVL